MLLWPGGAWVSAGAQLHACLKERGAKDSQGHTFLSKEDNYEVKCGGAVSTVYDFALQDTIG